MRDDRNPQAAEHRLEPATAVDAAARLADPPDVPDHPLAVGSILQVQLQLGRATAPTSPSPRCSLRASAPRPTRASPSSGISTWRRSTRTALRMRVNMSAMGSVIMLAGPLLNPLPTRLLHTGNQPSSARLRKQIRQMPNLRYTARGRPQSLHRRSSRVENFGGRLAPRFSICLP